jgi:tetratricopeptide (TPR) repeat protein
MRKTLAEVDTLKPKSLIIDLRFNSGGDGSRVQDIVHEFIKREDNPPWNDLYILTGRKTFSAAIMLVDQFVDHVPFTAVGEPAGAALNHFGDPLERPLQRTGLRLNVSSLYHQLSESDDLSSVIPVDSPAPFSFADYAAGRDPAVDAILRGEEMRSIPLIALESGGAAARQAYLVRVAAFGSLGWWVPPKEIELRRACRRLKADGRMDDALETCKLNTEIHPTIWNTWYNLAETEKAAGKPEDALPFYRCVLEVDPNNFNGNEIRALFEEAGATPGTPEGCPVSQ